MKTKGFKFLPEELKGKRTPQDLFDFYKNNWLDCDADPDFLEQAFELGMEGKDLPNDWYNMGLTDMDYIEDMNSIGQDIKKRGIKAVFAEIRADAKEDNDTDLLEDRDFNAMVEDLEENEDLVECRECFDLFPKAECTKMDHGYICPTCGREQQSQDFSDVSFTDITTDLYDQEFPDVREYDSEFGPEMEERQKEYHVDDIVDALLKDEYDAIESYELADEMIQDANDVEEDMKDDLLDAIEHIKKEEEEHIDEINAAAGRVEADPEDEDKKDDGSEEDSDSEDEDDDKDEDEDDKDSDKDKDNDKDEDDKEKNEDLTEAAPSPEMVEGEEILDEKKESVFDKIWKPVNESLWVCKFKDAEIGKVSAETEEEALEKMQKEFPEYNYGECDGCFEVIQEEVCKVNKGINHTEDEQEVLNEEVEELEEGIFDGARFGETLDGFYKNGYVVYIRLPKDATAPGGFQSQIKATSFDNAKKLAKQYATKYAASKATVFVLPMKLAQADYDALDPAKKAFAPKPSSGDRPPVLAKFFAGGKEDTGITRAKEVAKGLGKIAKADKKLNKINNAEHAEEEVAEVADEVDTAPAETPEAEATPEVETTPTDAATEETVPEATPAAPASPKKTEANKKIKDALKASGMSKEEIQQLFKSGVLPKIRKALIGEGLELKDLEEGFDEEEETVECAWCNRKLPKCECHKEVDMGWLCDSCERAINSRGETLTFEQ